MDELISWINEVPEYNKAGEAIVKILWDPHALITANIKGAILPEYSYYYY